MAHSSSRLNFYTTYGEFIDENVIDSRVGPRYPPAEVSRRMGWRVVGGPEFGGGHAEGNAQLGPHCSGGPSELLIGKVGGQRFGTLLADPPWRFANRTGKVAPEHARLSRYPTMTFEEIAELPVPPLMLLRSHLYLWVPNALILEGLEVMKRWGFTYKTNLIWYKVRKDGGPDGRGVGFYFRNVTEMVLFGVRGGLRTLPRGRRQVNLFSTQKREHSRKPDELYSIIEECSPGPYLELFARHPRPNWQYWGNEIAR